MSSPVLITDLLAELGYGHPMAQLRAMEILVEAGLTSGKKSGIAAEKRALVRDLLKRNLVRQCPRCREEGRRESVPTERDNDCESCGGSLNRGAMNQAWSALRKGSLRRVLIVGGGPGVHSEIRSLVPEDIELRIVPGDGNENEKSARSNLAWADLVVIWGGSILSHRVSGLYTEARSREKGKVVSLQRRGIAALAKRIREHCESKA
jgi:hypothetical protein